MQQVIEAASALPLAESVTNSPKPAGGKHVAYLDGLRGIAILAVVMVHASFGIGLGTALSNFTFYGVRGVQLFFIVSGMTLTMAHLNRSLNVANFVARRYFRIAPMFYLGIIIYLALGAWTEIPSGTHNARLVDFAATTLFMNGWLPDDASKVVPGGWSIGAESMFYVVFPAILTVAQCPRRLAAFVAASYVFAGVAHFALARFFPTIAMTFWVCQLPAFAGGCLLAVIGDKVQTSRSLALTALWASIAAVIVDSQLRGHSNLLVAILLLTIFVWAISHVRPKIIQSGPLPYLGQISFSIYILHFAVLAAVDYVWKILAPPVPPVIAFALVYLATMALVTSAATLTFRYVEQPFISFGRKVGRRHAGKFV